MPDSSRIKLNDILRDERKTRSKLVPLESDFYESVAAQIRELEEEKRKIDDIYSTKYAILEDELKTARKAIDNIVERRTAKIISLASLHSSSKPKDQKEIDSMTPGEREFYNNLLQLMTGYRSELMDRIFIKKEKQAVPLQPQVSRYHEPKETSSEGKKDINKEYIVVRLLKDIPTFVGADGRNYTLAKEDVAVLSAVNAKALINRNAAIQISVKR
jgi:DNA replication factor GINS